MLLHPGFSQATVWLAGRNETLLLVILVPSFLAFVRFVETTRPAHWWAHLGLWTLALLTRENAALFPAVSLALVAGFLALRGFREPRIAWFGTVWFALLFLPVLVKPNDPAGSLDIIEIRCYTASLGLGILLGSVDWPKALGLSRETIAGTGFALLLLCAGLSFELTGHYRNRITFWERAVRDSPQSAFARNNLGAMYFLAGREDLAEGRWREAEREIKAELSFNPLYDHAHFNLGLLYYRTGRVQEALRLWERTIELRPDYADAYANLAVHHLRAGNPARAARYLGSARRRGIAVPVPLALAVENALREEPLKGSVRNR